MMMTIANTYAEEQISTRRLILFSSKRTSRIGPVRCIIIPPQQQPSNRVGIVVVVAANPPRRCLCVWYSCSCSFILLFVFCTVGGFSKSRMTMTTMMATMIQQTASISSSAAAAMFVAAGGTGPYRTLPH